MGRTTWELPIPPSAGEDVERLRTTLAGTRGVYSVTIDAVAGVLRVEVDPDEIARHRLTELLGSTAPSMPLPLRAVPLAADPAKKPGPTPSGHAHADLRTLAKTNRRRLRLVLLGGTVVLAAELVGWWYSGALVLLADAVHYATDILAVLLAFLALSWSLRPATRAKTFGYQRAEVVAAFVQALALWAISGFLLWEAYKRIQDPPPVDGTLLLIFGATTLAANAVLAAVLRRGSENINMRAAYLHILGDVLGSAAALAAGLLIRYRNWTIADPLLTIFITLLIVIFTWKLTRQTLHILLEGSPHGLDHAKLESRLLAIPGVTDVHDLHVWTLTNGVDSLSAHVVLDDEPTDDSIAHEVHRRLRDEFKIDHVTVQVESPKCPCETYRHGVDA